MWLADDLHGMITREQEARTKGGEMVSFGRGVIAREHVTPYEEDLQLILSRFYVSFLLLR